MKKIKNILLFFKKIYIVARPYWVSEQKWKGLIFVSSMIVLIFTSNWMLVQMNGFQGDWMNNLNSKNRDGFQSALYKYFGIFAIYIPTYIFYIYLKGRFGISWRKWYAEKLISDYFQYKVFYKIHQENIIDNPDQRLSEDVRSFVDNTIVLFMDMLDAISTAISFGVVLWIISHDLFWVAMGTAFISTIFGILVFGNMLSDLNFKQYKLEADFRFSLMRVREHAESIAFYNGEFQENIQIVKRLGDVVKNMVRIILVRTNLFLFSVSTRILIAAIPTIMIADKFFNGEVQIGVISQAEGAFGQLMWALMIVLNSLQQLTNFTADMNRLHELVESIEAKKKEKNDTNAISIEESKNGIFLSFQNLHVSTFDSEKILMQNLNFQISKGDNLLVMGPSGCGKTSLLRVLARLWNCGSGNIKMPPIKDFFFLPQRPYMIHGSLKAQLLYPGMNANISDDKLQETLKKVRLGDLPSRIGGFDKEIDFSHVLSLGEQQRIAFARLLISNQPYAILDESTSALDSENETNLYSLIKESGIFFISVGHRDSIRKFHDKLLYIENKDKWELRDIV